MHFKLSLGVHIYIIYFVISLILLIISGIYMNTIKLRDIIVVP